MRKVLIILCAFLCAFLCIGTEAYAEGQHFTSINDLIENEKSLDGRIVTVKAEAIGEPMKRGSFTWVNVNDGSNAMGIWIKDNDASKIKFYGKYKEKGDLLEIRGTFNRSCTEHGGDTDIHALDVKILKHGNVENTVIDGDIKKAAVIAPLSTIFMIAVYYLYCHFKRL